MTKSTPKKNIGAKNTKTSRTDTRIINTVDSIAHLIQLHKLQGTLLRKLQKDMGFIVKQLKN